MISKESLCLSCDNNNCSIKKYYKNNKKKVVYCKYYKKPEVKQNNDKVSMRYMQL